MSASLTALVNLRSRLAEDLLAYLDALVEELAALPAYFPAHLRTKAGVASGFDAIRQIVQVIEDREAFEQWLRAEALVSEQARAAGREFSRRAYAPRRARPERAEEEGERREAKRPPPPVPWDDAAAARFRHAVILRRSGLRQDLATQARGDPPGAPGGRTIARAQPRRRGHRCADLRAPVGAGAQRR